jgi:small subunit ribosomal protein S19e
MTTVYDVPADLLIHKVAEKLKGMEHIEEPEWAPFVKTAVHKEKAPKQDDWWFVREAAVLRQVYIHGPIGTIHLRARFSGPKDRGVKPQKVALGSGSVIRTALKQMEKAELLQTVKGKGREVTPKGRSLMDNCAYEVLQEIIKDNPELGKY